MQVGMEGGGYGESRSGGVVGMEGVGGLGVRGVGQGIERVYQVGMERKLEKTVMRVVVR